MAVLLIGQEIDRQRQPTPAEPGHHTLLTQCIDQTVEGHVRDMTDHRAPLQTEAPVRAQQGITGHFWPHLTITQDEMREDCKYRATRAALKTPDGDPTQTDKEVMRVTDQAPTSVAGALV